MMYASVNGAQRAIGLYAGVDGAVRRLDQDTSDATATAADIAQGKTAYTAGGKVTGTFPDLKGTYSAVFTEYGSVLSVEDCFCVLFDGSNSNLQYYFPKLKLWIEYRGVNHDPTDYLPFPVSGTRGADGRNGCWEVDTDKMTVKCTLYKDYIYVMR